MDISEPTFSLQLLVPITVLFFRSEKLSKPEEDIHSFKFFSLSTFTKHSQTDFWMLSSIGIDSIRSIYIVLVPKVDALLNYLSLISILASKCVLLIQVGSSSVLAIFSPVAG